MIIRRDDDERHLLDRGEIHPFVKRASLHPAFADAGHADEILFAAKTFRHQRPDNNWNHRAEVTNHRQTIISGPPAVNVPIAAAHRAKS